MFTIVLLGDVARYAGDKQVTKVRCERCIEGRYWGSRLINRRVTVPLMQAYGQDTTTLQT